MSHELKTPLTSVRLAVHVLLEELVGTLEPKQVELLIEARENTERLFQLIEHLLDLAKLENAPEQFHFQPADPIQLLRDAAEQAASRAEDKRVTLTIVEAHNSSRVAVDTVRFAHALNNLIDNAIAYTESGGTITLSITAVDSNRTRISVSDTGIGIPAEHLPHVFERFFRVPGNDHRPGTGLGLAIVREIVIAHGGEISCESEPGHGTTFHITISNSQNLS